MEILGYIGFAVLILIALLWTIGVRTQFDASAGTIIGTIFLLVSAVVLAVSDISKLHSLWIIPAGFGVALVVSFIGSISSVLLVPFRVLAGIFASIVRIGIPAERIRAGQEAGLRASVEEWARRNKGDGNGA